MNPRRVGLAAARAAVVFCLLVTSFASVATAQTPQGATLTVLNGLVAVVKASGAGIQPASSGISLAVGDQVGTVGHSSALLTFFEGSEMELGEDTTIIIREIRTSGSETHVTIEDVLGRTVSRIKTFANPNSTYQVQNPGGQVTAVIRGSGIVLGVFPSGAVLVGAFDCSAASPCILDIFGMMIRIVGEGYFLVTPKGEIIEVSPRDVPNIGDPHQDEPGKGDGNPDENDNKDQCGCD